MITAILLALFTFYCAIDQFSLTEIIYRPIIAGPIFGAILGDVNAGLVFGGTFELAMVGNLPVGGAQPPNAVLGTAVGVMASINLGLKPLEALGFAFIFAVFGSYVVNLVFTLMSAVLVKADKAAEEGNPAGIAQVNYISMFFLGTLFAIIALIPFFAGEAVKESLEAFKNEHEWFLVGLAAAGGMMRYVGFAILMKIMLAGDMWGIYFAGFAAAAVLGNVSATAGATLLLCAFIGTAIAIYDYTLNVKIKNSLGNGGMSDGI